MSSIFWRETSVEESARKWRLQNREGQREGAIGGSNTNGTEGPTDATHDTLSTRRSSFPSPRPSTGDPRPSAANLGPFHGCRHLVRSAHAVGQGHNHAGARFSSTIRAFHLQINVRPLGPGTGVCPVPRGIPGSAACSHRRPQNSMSAETSFPDTGGLPHSPGGPDTRPFPNQSHWIRRIWNLGSLSRRPRLRGPRPWRGLEG